MKIVILKTTDGKLLFHIFGYHKLLLGIFGLLLDGTRGFIIGFIVGCFFDMRFIRKVAPPKQADLRLSFIMLAAFLLQVTGLESALNPETLKTRLTNQFGSEYTGRRMNFFRELLRQRIQVEAICDQLKMHASLDEKISLVKFLFEVTSHPRLNIEKLNQTIYYLANRIDLDSKYVRQLSADFESQRKTHSRTQSPPGSQSYNESDEFTVFGLQKNCTERELKKAYHFLAKKYHPDVNPGNSISEKNKMQEKFRLITEAYEKIKLMRGWI